MVSFEESQELERLRNDLRALEDEGGLTAIMERAREGRFIPLGAFGEKTTPQEYFADEHDHLRDKTRDAYFPVENIELRKKLIAAQREVESRLRRSLEEKIVRVNREIAVATAKAQQQPWAKAALVGVGAVALGYWVFGIAGAIAGAVGGFFLGQGVISQARNEANGLLAQASGDLEQAQKDKTENSQMTDFFSQAEAISGNRDKDFDTESAYANVLQASKSG